MRELEYLKLLAKDYPTLRDAAREILELKALLSLPKGTEYFFSDLHGEDQAFSYLLRSSSGIIREKIRETFGHYISETDEEALAKLIYYPRRTIRQLKRAGEYNEDWQKTSIYRLVTVCRAISSKYSRAKVREKLPQSFAGIISETLWMDYSDPDKQAYFNEILATILETGVEELFIQDLCKLIRDLTIDSLHIIGDIFDRGPRADRVMDELMNFHDVDIQWGNHDITWMGAAAGSRVCICNVLRIAISYNGFDQLEDGYGINLRPLSMFASEVYGKDPCKRFMPHDLSQNIYDTVDPMLAAKMHKAVTIMQFKLEGQTIRRHPEYHMEHRNFLEQIDYAAGTVMLDGKKRKLQDKNFPTVDPEDPLKLTPAEEELLRTLQTSFTHSERLRRQVDFLYTNGSMYKSCNGNLLYHGCIPMLPDGSFETVDFAGEPASGKQLMDLLEKKVLQAYYMEEDTPEKRVMTDLMWYLSCGPKSPLFGRDRITTFECSFVDDKKKTGVVRNPYYQLSEQEEFCKKILDEFEVPGERRHIINGHMLEEPKEGELPIRAGGMLYVIDGGLTRAHRRDLEYAGYALIYNSHHLALAKHKPFNEYGGTTPEVTITEEMASRVMIADTDEGRELEQRISDLKELIEAYRSGAFSEKTN